ncbi:putative S-locus glycoprotein [Helianthus debilis subsp. tardiflorus]
MEGVAIALFALLYFHKCYAAELDKISDSRLLTYEDTLVSPTGIFELGFFQPGNSKNTYLGIWYKKISVRTVVWVANRNHPLPGASMFVLKITDQGNLGLFNNISIIWSSNTTTSGNAIAKLLDNGNLVVIDQNEKVWESFDYPTDTLLPGMKIGRDYVRRKEWYLSSWKSSHDPAPGELTWAINTVGYPELKLKQGDLVIHRGRPWRNQPRIGISHFPNITLTYHVTINEHKVIDFYKIQDTTTISRIILNSSVHQQAWVWAEDGRGWVLVDSHPGEDTCDTYNICNAYGICNSEKNQQSCTCLDKKRFVPKNQTGWDIADWSAGCSRRTPLECKNGSENFTKYSNVKLPDTENTWFNMSLTLEECKTKCVGPSRRIENKPKPCYTNPLASAESKLASKPGRCKYKHKHTRFTD